MTIYMPMMPDTAMAMLACTRIGCPHSVVFAGFTATSLKDRIVDSQSKWVCTADVGKRGSKTIKLKEITDAAVNDCPNVERLRLQAHGRARRPVPCAGCAHGSRGAEDAPLLPRRGHGQRGDDVHSLHLRFDRKT